MKVNAGILHGAWLQLISGFALAGIAPAINKDEHINGLTIGIKAVVITVIFFIAYTYNKKEKTPTWVVPSIAGLVTLNIAVAVILGVMQSAA